MLKTMISVPGSVTVLEGLLSMSAAVGFAALTGAVATVGVAAALVGAAGLACVSVAASAWRYIESWA